MIFHDVDLIESGLADYQGPKIKFDEVVEFMERVDRVTEEWMQERALETSMFVAVCLMHSLD